MKEKLKSFLAFVWDIGRLVLGFIALCWLFHGCTGPQHIVHGILWFWE